MANKAKSPYRGDLAKHIPKRFKGEALGAEVRRRFELLVAHYGLNREDPDFDWEMALKLMRDHVPGLFSSHSGAPKTKNTSKRKQLRAALLRGVEDLRARDRLSDTGACREIKDRLARHETGHPFAGKSLRFLQGELRQARQEYREIYMQELVRVLGKKPRRPDGLFALGAEITEEVQRRQALIAALSKDRSSDS